MKTFAQIDARNMVINLIVAKDDFKKPGFIEYTDANPAFLDGDYFDGMFYEPQPFASWSRNNGRWVPPIAMPADAGTGDPPKRYYWDEATTNWIEVTPNE